MQLMNLMNITQMTSLTSLTRLRVGGLLGGGTEADGR